jgi:hypothetical protein
MAPGRRGPTKAIKLEEHDVLAVSGEVPSSRTANVVYNAYLCGLLGCTGHVEASATNAEKIEHLRSVLLLASPTILLEDAGSGPRERKGPFVEYDAQEHRICVRMHRRDATKDRWGFVQAPRGSA